MFVETKGRTSTQHNLQICWTKLPKVAKCGISPNARMFGWQNWVKMFQFPTPKVDVTNVPAIGWGTPALSTSRQVARPLDSDMPGRCRGVAVFWKMGATLGFTKKIQENSKIVDCFDHHVYIYVYKVMRNCNCGMTAVFRQSGTWANRNYSIIVLTSINLRHWDCFVAKSAFNDCFCLWDTMYQEQGYKWNDIIKV